MSLYFGLLFYSVDELTYTFRIIEADSGETFPNKELDRGVYFDADADPANLQRVLLNRLATYQGRKITPLGRKTIIAEMKKYKEQVKN